MKENVFQRFFSCRKRETRARKKHGGQYRKFAYQKMQASTKNAWHSFSASFPKCRSQNGREGANNYTEHIRWMVPKLLPGVWNSWPQSTHPEKTELQFWNKWTKLAMTRQSCAKYKKVGNNTVLKILGGSCTTNLKNNCHDTIQNLFSSCLIDPPQFRRYSDAIPTLFRRYSPF